MNNFYSSPELYYKRWMTPLLQQAVQDHSVVVLTGARQVGKSTLLFNEEPFKNWRYLSLDDFDTLRQVRQNPAALWAGTYDVVLDEVQRAPEILPAIKQAVDRQPGKYHFVLSGSANLLLMQQVSESLAGRAVYFVLDPMTLGETLNLPAPTLLNQLISGLWPTDGILPGETPEALPLLERGFMPPLLKLESPQAWARWWDGYVATYLERDLRQFSQIDALVDFRRLMELLSLRSGQLLNQAELARDGQLSQPTVHRYLNLLESTHMFDRLPAYLSNRTTRLLKAPKAFWNDSGLAVFLAGYYDLAGLGKARELGNFFETMIYHHLRVLAGLMTPSGRIYFWRTQSGVEVDLVLEHGRHLLAFEVKQTSKPGYGDAAGLRAFLAEHPHTSAGVLLHTGPEIRRLDEKIIALPWVMIASGTQTSIG